MEKFKEIRPIIKFGLIATIVIFLIMSNTTIAVRMISTGDSDNLNNSENEMPVRDSDNEMIFTYDLSGLTESQISTDLGVFTLLQIQGSGFIGELGKPQLPVVTYLYAIPTMEFSVEIVETTVAEIRDIGRIFPAQYPQMDHASSDNQEFVFDSSFYALDILYPEEIYQIVQKGNIRDVPFVQIEFYPVQYNPSLGRVTIYETITIKLSWEEHVPLETEHDFEQAPFYRFYQSVFSNWDDFLQVAQFIPSTTTANGEGCEYLIITHPEFESKAQDLQTWKHSRGIITQLVDTSETGTTAEDIRQYIQEAYDTWDPRPSYILLVGDAEDIPTNYLYTHPYHHSLTASDMWYVTVDGGDYYPDIYIGRIPADTTTDAERIIDKIMGYEITPPELSSFYSHAAAAAYFQDENPRDGYEDRRFVRTSEEIRDYLLTLGFDVDRIYTTPSQVYPTHYNDGWYGNGEPLPPELLKPDFPWDGDAADIINAINQGSIIVNHRDHGSEHYWGDPYFDESHINSLTNGDLLPIVFSINCQTGWFDGSECFCEVFIEKNNGGAVGIVGATRVSYSGYNDYLCRGFYDAIWPDFDTNVGSDIPMYTMGEVLNYGKTYMANTWGDPWDYERVTFEMFHWFGDPSMEIWTDVPEGFIVDHPAEIEGSSMVTVTVYDEGENPVEGALVCISNTEGLYGRGITDENGVATFPINYGVVGRNPIVAEDAVLVVTAHNFLPYEATITVDLVHLGDINGDSVVNFQDLLLLLKAWGPNSGHAADLNGDGVVNLSDLFILLMNWG